MAQLAGRVRAHRALEEPRGRRLEESLEEQGARAVEIAGAHPRADGVERSIRSERAQHPSTGCGFASSPRRSSRLRSSCTLRPAISAGPMRNSRAGIITARSVHGGPALADLRPGIGRDGLPRPARQADRAIGIVEQRGDGARHGGGIPLRHEDARVAVPEHLGDRARRRGHDGQPRGERLEHRDRLIVDERGVDEDVGLVGQRRHVAPARRARRSARPRSTPSEAASRRRAVSWLP